MISYNCFLCNHPIHGTQFTPTNVCYQHFTNVYHDYTLSFNQDKIPQTTLISVSFTTRFPKTNETEFWIKIKVPQSILIIMADNETIYQKEFQTRPDYEECRLIADRISKMKTFL